MGYSLNHKGYKCLDPQTNRTYISHHVLFDEGSFPFSKLNEHIPINTDDQNPIVVSARPPILPHKNTTTLTPSATSTHSSISHSKACDLFTTDFDTFMTPAGSLRQASSHSINSSGIHQSTHQNTLTT